MALYASGVTIPNDLSSALSGPGSPGYNAQANITANYAGAKKQLGQGIQPGGNSTGPNTYAGNQMATQQGLATGNLESALGGGLGNTAYQNTLQQRDFGQNEALAEQVAAMNKPNLLQQVLGGIGNVGGTAAKIYGAWGSNASPGVSSLGQGGNAAAQGPASLLQGYGPSRYGFGSGGGY